MAISIAATLAGLVMAASTTPTLDEVLDNATRYRPPEAPAEAPLAAPAALSIPAPAVRPAAYLNDRGMRLDGQPTVADQNYEGRVLDSFRRTQVNQGPLDGRWRVKADSQSDVYILQLTDPGAGEGRIEGAWRRASQDAPASGLLGSVRRDGGDLILPLTEPDSGTTEIRIRPASHGWTGQVASQSGLLNIILTRDEGIETAALASPVMELPAPPKAAKVKAKPKKAKAKAKKKTTKKKKR